MVLRGEIVEEVKDERMQKRTSSVSVTDDHSYPKLSPCPIGAVESPAPASPATTSIFHLSTAESANVTQSNGCCTPDNHLHDKKTSSATAVGEEGKIEAAVSQRPKSAGKWSTLSEAHAALSSFEAMLATLTRTKESIGRATRMAIDCAKFGDSARVRKVS